MKYFLIVNFSIGKDPGVSYRVFGHIPTEPVKYFFQKAFFNEKRFLEANFIRLPETMHAQVLGTSALDKCLGFALFRNMVSKKKKQFFFKSH